MEETKKKVVWCCAWCFTKLINHYCGPCNVLNPEGIQLYCPYCEEHPTELFKI